MGVGAGLSMCVVVVQKFTFAISSPDEFLCDDLGTFALCGQIIYAPGDTVITHVTPARLYEISCYAHVRQR